MRSDVAPRLDLTGLAVAVAGIARGTFGSPPVGQSWTVRRVSLVGGLATGTGRFYLAAAVPAQLVLVAPMADLNAAGVEQVIEVPGGIPFIFEVDATTGAQVVASATGELVGC